jgi:hypothetical protein
VFEKLPRENNLDHKFLRLLIRWLNSTPGIQPATTHTREMARRNCEHQHYTSSQTLEFRSPAHARPREQKTAACPAKEFWPRALRFKQADSLTSELATEATTKMNPATGAAKGSTAGNYSSVGLDSRTKSGQGLHIAAETKKPSKERKHPAAETNLTKP